MLLLSPSCVHATVHTPAEPTGARIARFPAAGSLPRFLGGSASALPFSRPAQRSLHVVACTLAEPPEAALFHRSASVRVVTSFYVREVAESRNPDRIREPLFPCRRRRKPPQRPATDASPPSAGRAPGGLARPPGADGSDRFPPRPFEPCSSLVGPSQQFLHALNGSVGTDPHRKRTGTQECLLALERKTTQQ